MTNARATRRRLGRFLQPLRRAAAKFALVDNERSAREEIIAIHGSAIHLVDGRIDHLTAAMQAELRAVVNAVEALRAEIEGGYAVRADLTLSELWRRLEYADAQNATAIQRLRDDVDRLTSAESESQSRPAVISAASGDALAGEERVRPATNSDDKSSAEERSSR